MLIVVGSIFGLLLTALLLVSPIAKNYIEKHDKELIGRELSIGKLWVNVLSGSVNLKDVTLFEEDGITPFMSFDQFKTKIKVSDLFNKQLSVKRAFLSGLQINVEQNEEWFNFSSLVDFFSSDNTNDETPSFGLIINDINIDKGSVRYADLALGNEFLLRDLSLHIPAIDISDLKTDVGLDLNLADSATLHTDLQLSDNAKQYSINMKLQNIGIEVIEPYLQQYYPVDLLSGIANLDVEAQGLTEHILDFDLTGSIILKNVSIHDTVGHPLATVDSLFAELTRLRLNDKEIAFNNLYLSGLNAAYIVHADSTANVDLVLESYFGVDSTDLEIGIDTFFVENEKNKSWQVQIADLKLNNAKLLYEDFTLPEVFHYEITDINLSSKQFSRYGNNAIQMQAALNKVGKLHMNWQGSFYSGDNHNLTVMLSNVKVADFSPYTVQMFGVPVESGTLSFRSQNIITDGKINGINKLQIATPKLGDKVKQFQPQFEMVPLKLGLYLLSDKRNNVSLDLPVTGNLDDPSFSYRKTLAKVFSNLLTKAASSPFRLLTDEDNNLKYIPFDPLQFDFTPEQYVMIDNVATTLQSRSDLAIVLEEQVQYEEIINQLCIMQLKYDYYLSLHPELTSSNIDFITNEAIRAIKLNDKGLCGFAADCSKKKRLHSKKDVALVAYELYREKSENMLPQLMERRNRILSDYFFNVRGLSTEQISVTTIDASLMKSFKKSSRYEMHVFTYEDME